VRQLRSAASQYMLWDFMMSRPGEAVLTPQRKLLVQACRPTDSVAYTLHAAGMSSRLGTHTNPSMPLLDRHVRWLDADLNRRYQEVTSERQRCELARAGLLNLFLWLGWLRSSEARELRWCDVSVTEPQDFASKDLPVNVGCIGLRLGPETKSDRTRAVDVVIAYRTISGLCPGRWFHRLRRDCGLYGGWNHSTISIFLHRDGAVWTSHYFRQSYLYPALTAQRGVGDAYLTPFTNDVGNQLQDKFWSLHCYRRGARSHVTKGGHFGLYRFRRASKDQVYEHGRWRLRRSSEAIDKQYDEWTVRQRLELTLYCH
jgi:integrase